MEINAIILRDEVILERERFLQFQILIWFSVIILLALLPFITCQTCGNWPKSPIISGSYVRLQLLQTSMRAAGRKVLIHSYIELPLD